MKLSVKGSALAGAVIWAGGLLAVVLIHHFHPGYGVAFLNGIRSLYHGHPGGSLHSLVIGLGVAVVDGAVTGALAAWIHNLLS